jgi:hypothetical protein
LSLSRCTRHRGFLEYDLSKKGNRVAKQRTLIFKANVHGPGPYELYWKVRNGGAEAAQVGQLRGEITLDAGSNRNKDPSQYKGSLYFECYGVSNGVVGAKDRHPVMVT